MRMLIADFHNATMLKALLFVERQPFFLFSSGDGINTLQIITTKIYAGNFHSCLSFQIKPNLIFFHSAIMDIELPKPRSRTHTYARQ